MPLAAAPEAAAMQVNRWRGRSHVPMRWRMVGLTACSALQSNNHAFKEICYFVE